MAEGLFQDGCSQRQGIHGAQNLSDSLSLRHSR